VEGVGVFADAVRRIAFGVDETNNTRGRVESGRAAHCFCACANSAAWWAESGQWVKPRKTTVQ
jgi:hypothetical protein